MAARIRKSAAPAWDLLYTDRFHRTVLVQFKRGRPGLRQEQQRAAGLVSSRRGSGATAQVARACPHVQTNLSDSHQHLVAIHAAPPQLWPTLAEATPSPEQYPGAGATLLRPATAEARARWKIEAQSMLSELDELEAMYQLLDAVDYRSPTGFRRQAQAKHGIGLILSLIPIARQRIRSATEWFVCVTN